MIIIMTNSLIFANITFSIFEYGVDLAAKRANVIIEIIKNNGGSYIPIKQSIFIFNLVTENNLPDYVISSKALNLPVYYNLINT